jgi:hypothetical protein
MAKSKLLDVRLPALQSLVELSAKPAIQSLILADNELLNLLVNDLSSKVEDCVRCSVLILKQLSRASSFGAHFGGRVEESLLHILGSSKSTSLVEAAGVIGNALRAEALAPQ